MTDYEKSEKQSWKDYLASDLRKVTGEHEWLAHKAGFRDGFSLGQYSAKEEAIARGVVNSDKSGNHEQIRAQIVKDLYVGGLNHPDTEVRSWCYGHLSEHIEDCIRYADSLLAELDKTKDNG